jgi:hypothetical protein
MKINGRETKAREFAYDGCHKIYLIESKEDRRDAEDCEYDILPISSLKKTYNISCGLQFISNWKLDKRYVDQFEEACIED